MDEFDSFSAHRLDPSARPRPAAGQTPGAPAFVGRVFGNPSVPASAGRFAWVRPVSISGPEVEGGPGILTPADSVAVPVLVLGSKAPAAGDHLICRYVGHRWVAERMSRANAGGLPTPNCPCPTVPAALRMTSLDTSCHNGMFRSGDLALTTTPADWAHLMLGPQLILGQQTFVDNDTGESFIYFFSCLPGAYTLRRIYPDSIYGRPFVDQIRYYWPFPLAGNSCSPFLLINGRVFQGGDTSCMVTISE